MGKGKGWEKRLGLDSQAYVCTYLLSILSSGHKPNIRLFEFVDLKIWFSLSNHLIVIKLTFDVAQVTVTIPKWIISQ